MNGKMKFTAVILLFLAVAFGQCDSNLLDVTRVRSNIEIISFRFADPPSEGIINEEDQTIVVFVPYGTNDLTTLVPTIIHTGESINPESGVAQDFTSSVVYTVTAEDSSTRDYTTTVFEDDFWAFAVSDTGQTGDYTATFGEDSDYVDIPNARSFTGPTQHGTYTDDYKTTDNVTGLIWKTCSEGLIGPDCSGGAAGTYTWSNALTACTDLNDANSGAGYTGRTDWRLPSIEELNTLPDYVVYNPAIDTVCFPNTASSYYWSSSTYVFNTDVA